MIDEATDGQATHVSSVGDRLREARMSAGLDLGEIASRTRIPVRHLEALEADNYGALPSPTYSTGFAKAYARAVGLDEVLVAADVRRAIALGGRERREYVAFEPADPARTPPRLLAWTAAVIAVLLLVGYGIWRTTSLPADPEPEVAANAPPEMPNPDTQAMVQPPAAPEPNSQPVVLSATDRVWLRVTDASGARLFERELDAGERYEVPADANGPRIMTGRPQALTVTVGGQEMPPLGPPDRTISNVPIDAASLRGQTPGAPATTAPAPPPAPAA